MTEFTKQRFDKLPSLQPGVLGKAASAGEVFAYAEEWDKVRVSKPRKLPEFKGDTFCVPTP